MTHSYIRPIYDPNVSNYSTHDFEIGKFHVTPQTSGGTLALASPAIPSTTPTTPAELQERFCPELRNVERQ